MKQRDELQPLPSARRMPVALRGDEHTDDARGGGTMPALIAMPVSPDFLDALAEHLAPRVAALIERDQDADHWMNSDQAADYLCMTKNALHKLTSAREIPFEQDGPGCKLWFRRQELDRWRRGGSNK